MGADGSKGQTKFQKQMDELTNASFQMKWQGKQLEKEGQKCMKEREQNMKKAKMHMDRGDMVSAQLIAGEAIRC